MRLKRHLKCSLCIEFKEKHYNLFFFRCKNFRDLKRLLNLDNNQYSYRERLIHSIRYLKRELSIEFKASPLKHFSLWEPLPKPKIGLLNLDFHQFFCSEQLLYLKRHLKEIFHMSIEENHWSFFFTHFQKLKIGL